jgi:hypothetical protein
MELLITTLTFHLILVVLKAAEFVNSILLIVVSEGILWFQINASLDLAQLIQMNQYGISKTFLAHPSAGGTFSLRLGN